MRSAHDPTTNSHDPNVLLGFAWDTGESQGEAKASLTMSRGPIVISGSVGSGKSGRLDGKFGTARFHNAPVDAYPETASHAWWRSNCTNAKNCGSQDWQAQVHHALSRYPESTRNIELLGSWHARYHCGRPRNDCATPGQGSW